MKKIFLSFLLLLFLSLLLPQSSFARMAFTDIECFKEVTSLSPSENLFISTKYDDILVRQGENELQVTLYDWVYKYIPFETNITQVEQNQKYKNTYGFGDIDTSENTEIILKLKEQLQKDNFRMNFSYDAQYYTPKFYISEDTENSYFQILQSDISDYTPTHIKISFIPKGNESIREIIKIRDLSIMRNTSIWKIGANNFSENIMLYGGNSCGQTRDNIEVGTSRLGESFIFPIFQENLLYKEKTSDTDKDGIKNLYDNCKMVQNKDQKDINQNGVGDACEFDTDSDGIPDEIDNCRNTENPDQKDDDNDGIGNVCDNCKLYNPDQKDSDENSIGDVCDTQKNYLLANDEDSDGVVNNRDNCKLVANPDQADDDNDGIGNVCDNCRAFQNYDQKDENQNGVGDICEDSDNDGIESLQDNCINVANPDQADDDNDGIGNMCEDDDRDTILFIQDNCPYIANKDQRDTDGDGLGDSCDETDDRFIESNKGVFIALMVLIILIFVGGIYIMGQKLKK